MDLFAMSYNGKPIVRAKKRTNFVIMIFNANTSEFLELKAFRIDHEAVWDDDIGWPVNVTATVTVDQQWSETEIDPVNW